MEKFKLTWELKKIKPRLDIQVSTTDEQEVLDAIIQAPYRHRHHKENTRHYKMPIRFHFQSYREELEERLNYFHP